MKKTILVFVLLCLSAIAVSCGGSVAQQSSSGSGNFTLQGGVSA